MIVQTSPVLGSSPEPGRGVPDVLNHLVIETFCERFLATYRFRRNFGREELVVIILGRDPGGLGRSSLKKQEAEEDWGRSRWR
jgi:hypothetical protein